MQLSILTLLLTVELVWGSAYSHVTHKNQHAKAVQACNLGAPEKSSFLDLYDSTVSASCIEGACAPDKKCGDFFCVEVTGHVPEGMISGLTSAAKSFLEKVTKQTTENVECPGSDGHPEPATQITLTTPTMIYFERYPTKADEDNKTNSNGYLEVIISQHEDEVACDVINDIFQSAIGATGEGGIFGVITQICEEA